MSVPLRIDAKIIRVNFADGDESPFIRVTYTIGENKFISVTDIVITPDQLMVLLSDAAKIAFTNYDLELRVQ